MKYISEFVGSLVFLGLGYGYMCNIKLKKTLISEMRYIELVVAWALAIGLGLMMAVVMGGPAYLNPSIIIGQVILNNLPVIEAIKYLIAEFLAAGVAIEICLIFFYDSFKASPDVTKKEIFSAYPVTRNLLQNSVQEFIATFTLITLVLKICTISSTALQVGIIGFSCVGALALTYNSTGFSMNPMRSVFSSIWFTIFKMIKVIPTTEEDKVDWTYQLIVNGLASTAGGLFAVLINCSN